MSEYQYYEFRTVDRPLTSEQMSELRALSTRAVITQSSFTNTYHYGDFRGNPRHLMESCFDAHVYVSNFGVFVFMLRLPRAVLPDETLARYAADNGLDWWTTDSYTILEWRRDGESLDDWMEGENWMGSLLSIRDELVRGDYRPLYIGWLSSLADVEYEEDATAEGNKEEEKDEEDYDDVEEDDDGSSASRPEPPVPAGLGTLTAAQVSLTEFLYLDSDLLDVAAAASPPIAATENSEQNLVEWAARLPEQEMRVLITRLLRGEGQRVQTELQSWYHRSRGDAPPTLQIGEGAKRRTAAELVALAAQKANKCKQQELEAQERKRHAQLAGLVPRFAELWTTVNALAEEQKASAYEKVGTLLVEMREAYTYANRRPEFDAEFARFLAQYSRRTALVRKLKEVRLLS